MPPGPRTARQAPLRSTLRRTILDVAISVMSEHAVRNAVCRFLLALSDADHDWEAETVCSCCTAAFGTSRRQQHITHQTASRCCSAHSQPATLLACRWAGSMQLFDFPSTCYSYLLYQLCCLYGSFGLTSHLAGS
jgi:hypothetical protein